MTPRSDRRFTVLLAVAVVLLAGLILTASLLSALHHGHKAGLSTSDVLWGV